MYIVFTEIIKKNGIERWYYGTYEHDRANDVAYQLGQNWEEQIFHSICKVEEARAWKIRNLPC